MRKLIIRGQLVKPHGFNLKNISAIYGETHFKISGMDPLISFENFITLWLLPLPLFSDSRISAM